MRKERKHYTGEEKVAILRRHLLDKVPVSDLCDELGLQPTVFYRWQKEFFENGAAAFSGKSHPDHQAEQQRIEFLEKAGLKNCRVFCDFQEVNVQTRIVWWPEPVASNPGLCCIHHLSSAEWQVIR